jgi:hypothetical protein
MTMGSPTDAKIAAWQEQAGIRPAVGLEAELLEKLSQAAFDLIKVIELQRSGIRDGNGWWHGGDGMGGMLSEMEGLCAAYRNRRPEPSQSELAKARAMFG